MSVTLSLRLFFWIQKDDEENEDIPYNDVSFTDKLETEDIVSHASCILDIDEENILQSNFNYENGILQLTLRETESVGPYNSRDYNSLYEFLVTYLGTENGEGGSLFMDTWGGGDNRLVTHDEIDYCGGFYIVSVE